MVKKQYNKSTVLHKKHRKGGEIEEISLNVSGRNKDLQDCYDLRN
jgi:hypothetical protein